MKPNDLCSLLIIHSSEGNLDNVKLLVQTIKKMKTK